MNTVINSLLLTYLLIIFVFIKIYESVVTVNGEDLGNIKTMKSFYNAVYDLLELQIEVIDYLVEYYRSLPKKEISVVIEKYIGVGEFDNLNIKISNMLEKMKDSLFDNKIGNLDKSQIIDFAPRLVPFLKHYFINIIYRLEKLAHYNLILITPGVQSGFTLNNYANYYHLSAKTHVETVVLIEKE